MVTDKEKMLNQIIKNYKLYQWHKRKIPCSYSFTQHGAEVDRWGVYYETKIGGGEYKEKINDRYGTGTVYIIVSNDYHINIHYFPKGNGFYETSFSCNLYNILGEYLEKQEKKNKEKTERDKKVLEQRYEADIVKMLDANSVPSNTQNDVVGAF